MMQTMAAAVVLEILSDHVATAAEFWAGVRDPGREVDCPPSWDMIAFAAVIGIVTGHIPLLVAYSNPMWRIF